MEGKKRIIDFVLFKRVFAFTKPYKNWFYISLATAIVMAVLAPVRPWLIQVTIDVASGKNILIPAWLQNILFLHNGFNVLNFIIHVTVFQLLFIVVETVVRFLFAYITAKLGQYVVKDMRDAVYTKILKLKLRQFDNTPIGTLTTRTINDIESINEIFSDGLIPIIADLLVIMATLCTMFYLNWQLTLIALMPFPILIFATYIFKESVNASFIRVRNAVAALNTFVQEHLTGIGIVQAFAAEQKEMNKFKNINAEHKNANIKAIFAYSVFFPVVELVLAISTGLAVWWIAGEKLNPGLLVAFILYLNQLFRPLRVIADKFNVLQMGMIAAERVFKVLDNNDEEEISNANNLSVNKVQGKIEFKNVSFAYKKDYTVLKNISLTIEPGEVVAIVGHTGSGKTSIISILSKLYPIQQGEILIDSININQIPNEVLRQQIGVVLQDVFLFSGSIMDNITLHNNAISKDKVITIAKAIGVHNFIMQLPGNYDFDVKERGHTLSLGQRQLISFIRALIYNPKILVLDEATSSIDTQTELLIQHAIETVIKNRTSIIIAHRLSTIKKANKIIVLDKGEIVETGTHVQLLAKNGFYAALHQKQFKELVN